MLLSSDVPQVKKSILEEEIYCPPEASVLLASYAVHAKVSALSNTPVFKPLFLDRHTERCQSKTLTSYGCPLRSASISLHSSHRKKHILLSMCQFDWQLRAQEHVIYPKALANCTQLILCQFRNRTVFSLWVRSVYRLSSPFFLLFLLSWKRLATRLSLVSCQKGAWCMAFFSEKLNFFSTWKDALSCRKDAGGGVLKSAQDFFLKHCLLHRIIM